MATEEMLPMIDRDSVPTDTPTGATTAARIRSGEAKVTRPIVVDLGKKSSRQIKQLKRGEGKLWVELAEVIGEVKTQLGDELNGKTMVPLVVVYRKKARRRLAWPWPLAPR